MSGSGLGFVEPDADGASQDRLLLRHFLRSGRLNDLLQCRLLRRLPVEGEGRTPSYAVGLEVEGGKEKLPALYVVLCATLATLATLAATAATAEECESVGLAAHDCIRDLHRRTVLRLNHVAEQVFRLHLDGDVEAHGCSNVGICASIFVGADLVRRLNLHR